MDPLDTEVQVIPCLFLGAKGSIPLIGLVLSNRQVKAGA